MSSADTADAARDGKAKRSQGDLALRTSEVVAALGISRRQLQYWAQTDLVRPSLTTPGGHRRYTLADLVALKAAIRLIDAGISVQRIRASIKRLQEALPRVQQPLGELVLVATGDIVLVIHDGSAFEAVSGQEWIFEVAEFQRELAAWQGNKGEVPVRKPRTVRRQDRSKRSA